MKKGIIALIIFCLFTLALFGGFSYLLAHVDPPRISPLPPLPKSGKTAGITKKERPQAEPPTETPKPERIQLKTAKIDPTAEESFFRRRKDYGSDRDRQFEIYSYKRGTDDDNDDVDTATKITIIFETKIVNTTEKYIENTTEVVRQFSSADDDATKLVSNASQLISSAKGFRRSVENKGKEVDNSLLLKIMDNKGKPRLEILIGNNGDTVKKLEKKNRLPRSKTKSKLYMFVKSDNNTIVNKADEFKPTVIKVMPNNSLIVSDPDDLSGYSNYISYNSTVDLMEEKFEITNMNNSRKTFLDASNSIHEVDENFTFRSNTKYTDSPYRIKVRFDNKTEIIRNENDIDNLKQKITNSSVLTELGVKNKDINIDKKKKNITSVNFPKDNISTYMKSIRYL